MVDADGTFTYSSIIKIISDKTNNSIVIIYPNPVLDKLIITATKSEVATITNNVGQVLYAFRLHIGNNNVDASGWASSVYFLRTKEQIFKIMKQ